MPFSLFGPRHVVDPVLGWLERRHGNWNGQAPFPFGTASIIVSGGRKGPDEQAVRAVHDFLRGFQSLVPAIESGVFNHYDAYRDAYDSGSFSVFEGEFPRLTSPGEVWAHISEPQIWAWAYGLGKLQFAFRVPWDPEHRLGAIYRGTQMLELCGSV